MKSEDISTFVVFRHRLAYIEVLSDFEFILIKSRCPCVTLEFGICRRYTFVIGTNTKSVGFKSGFSDHINYSCCSLFLSLFLYCNFRNLIDTDSILLFITANSLNFIMFYCVESAVACQNKGFIHSFIRIEHSRSTVDKCDFQV